MHKIHYIMNLNQHAARHLDPANPNQLPAAARQLISEHSQYMLQHRGFLYPFEQVMLMRVQREMAGPDEQELKKEKRREYQRRWQQKRHSANA
jgi:hypothetical protein